MVDAYKKGEMPDASPSIKKAAKGMTKKEVKDFAKTKHKGLPDHVNEEVCVDTQRCYGSDCNVVLGHTTNNEWFVYNKVDGKTKYFQDKETAEKCAEQEYKAYQNKEYAKRQAFNKEISLDEKQLNAIGLS